jgi:hypothetical protein
MAMGAGLIAQLTQIYLQPRRLCASDRRAEMFFYRAFKAHSFPKLVSSSFTHLVWSQDIQGYKLSLYLHPKP